MGLFEKRSEADEIKVQLAELAVKLADVRKQVGQLNEEYSRLGEACVEEKSQSDEYESYAKKAIAAGNPDDAKVFLAEKYKHDQRLAQFTEQFTATADTRKKAMELHDKMVREINAAKARLAVLEARNAAADAGMHYSKTAGSSKFDEKLSQMEADADMKEAYSDAKHYADDDWGGQ